LGGLKRQDKNKYEKPRKEDFRGFSIQSPCSNSEIGTFRKRKTKTQMNNPLKTMQIIHGALMTGILLFIALAYFITEAPTNMEDNSMFTYLWLGLTIPALVAVFYFYNNRRSAWEHLSSQSAKEQAYQSRMIVIYALIEGPCLFGTVLYILSAETLYLAAVGVLLLVFLKLRPTTQSFNEDLGIS